MPKPNPYLTENKKPFQTAQELKDEYKVPTYEEFMKGYENDEGINESYEDEIRSYGNIEVGKKSGSWDFQNAQFITSSDHGSF